MRNSTQESPIDRGEVEVPGRCQICGQVGRTVAIPGAPEPNQFCPCCAIEYGETAAPDDDELVP